MFFVSAKSNSAPQEHSLGIPPFISAPQFMQYSFFILITSTTWNCSIIIFQFLYLKIFQIYRFENFHNTKNRKAFHKVQNK